MPEEIGNEALGHLLRFHWLKSSNAVLPFKNIFMIKIKIYIMWYNVFLYFLYAVTSNQYIKLMFAQQAHSQQLK